MRSGEPGVLELDQWLLSNLPENSAVGVDAALISAAQAKATEKVLLPKNITLRPVSYNPVDKVWGSDRPAPPRNPIVIQPVSLAGVAHGDKVKLIQEKIVSKYDAVVVSMLDEVSITF